ncbi:MAG: hypothetical protein ABID87_00865 [Chloroflexota bacterium]
MPENKEKKAATKAKAEVLAPKYDPGEPQAEADGRWRQKLGTREEKVKYLRSGERYWYSTDWFGSEKRKTPA